MWRKSDTFFLFYHLQFRAINLTNIHRATTLLREPILRPIRILCSRSLLTTIEETKIHIACGWDWLTVHEVDCADRDGSLLRDAESRAPASSQHGSSLGILEYARGSPLSQVAHARHRQSICGGESVRHMAEPRTLPSRQAAHRSAIRRKTMMCGGKRVAEKKFLRGIWSGEKRVDRFLLSQCCR